MTYEYGPEQSGLVREFQKEVDRLVADTPEQHEGYKQRDFAPEAVELSDLKQAIGADVAVSRLTVAATDFLNPEGADPSDYLLELSGQYAQARLIVEFVSSADELIATTRVVSERPDGSLDRGRAHELAKNLPNELLLNQATETVGELMETVGQEAEVILKLSDDPDRFAAALRILQQLR